MGNLRDNEFKKFREAMQKRVVETFRSGAPIFRTNSHNICEVYLKSFHTDKQQYYNCSDCLDFIRKYGGLVTITRAGGLEPLLWGNLEKIPETYYNTVVDMVEYVKSREITGAFHNKNPMWGKFRSDGETWNHLNAYVWIESGSKESVINNNFKQVVNFVCRYGRKTFDYAKNLFQSQVLSNTHGVYEQLEFLQEAKELLKRKQINLVWLKIAKAPQGFCHPNASLIGTLIDDCNKNLSSIAILQRYKDKLHPLKYQRPEAPPKDGNIYRAEKLIERLGIADSLRRRYARFEEIEIIWTPKTKKTMGVFACLRESTRCDIPPMRKITLTKFMREILPSAEKITITAPTIGNYGAFTTAVVDDSPLIFKWDNPLDYFVYYGGSNSGIWGLSGNGVDYNVGALCFAPHMWGGQVFPNMQKSVMFVIPEIKIKPGRQTELALFPQSLKAELREVRSTIEAYSKKTSLEGTAEASACGLMFFDSPSNLDQRLFVTVTIGEIEAKYHIDRWD